MTQTASPILRQLTRMVEDRQVKNLSDADLLNRYLLRRDSGAFHALVRRHGNMVLSVCRCVLGNEADVEDAFQATFLVLVRKARSIRKRGSLSSWLYGVAHRICLKARSTSAKRRKHESQVQQRAPSIEADSPFTWPEVQRLVHDELNQLAERHRAPLILCYLQGKTQDEAATELGLAKTVLRGRLERGRLMLRNRLRRRGLGPAALLVISAWPVSAASASVPHALLSATVASAALLAAGSSALPAPLAGLVEGAVQSMMLTKVKMAASMLLAAFLICGFVGLWTWQAGATAGVARGHNPAEEAVIAAANDDAKPASASQRLLIAGIVVDA
jgi:RNA polymerase sigma factor (sigma-70 family)